MPFRASLAGSASAHEPSQRYRRPTAMCCNSGQEDASCVENGASGGVLVYVVCDLAAAPELACRSFQGGVSNYSN
jgi:hypothetical protein